MVVWIIGLSGSGKSVLAERVVNCLRSVHLPVVMLDGDVIREIYEDSLGYSEDDRLKSARRMCRFSKFLSDQGMIVICPFLSVFEESREWCRANVEKYYEVFVDTPMEILEKRDTKGLYADFRLGQQKNVVGCDILFQKPKSDFVIDNTGSLDQLLCHSDHIVSHIKEVWH